MKVFRSIALVLLFLGIVGFVIFTGWFLFVLSVTSLGWTLGILCVIIYGLVAIGSILLFIVTIRS